MTTMVETIDDFIEFCYNTILGRNSDTDGREAYIRFSDNGASKLDIVLSFIKSDEFQEQINKFNLQEFPPGHFYSPLPDILEIDSCYKKIDNTKIPFGININDEKQVKYIEKFSKYIPNLPFGDGIKNKNTRYYFNGDEWYSYGDAIVLFCMINNFHPLRFIEIGSGYSSLVTLDTCELLNLNTKITLIEPFPDLILSLLSDYDEPETILIKKEIQQVNISLFDELDNNDIIFIDCSHVVKFASDVLYIFTEILPRLRSGVIIHIHDIFWPFEYPLTWLKGGRAWNEAYFLKLFLINNKEYDILYFNDYMGQFHPDLIKRYMPLAMKNFGCGIWLKKK